MNITNEKKTSNYSQSLNQNSHQKIVNCLTNIIRISIILVILNEEDLDTINDEMFNDTVFETSETERETFESIEEIK